MTSENLLQIEHIDVPKSWSWWNVGAACGLLGGLSAIFIGFVLTLIMWLFKQDSAHISLQTVTNVLFYSSFPMLFFGGYCLDKIDELVKKNNRDK